MSNFYVQGVSAYRIVEDGTLKPLTGSPFATAGVSGSIVVDPLGRFVYVNNFDYNGASSVSAYRIGGNGALKPVPGSPFHIEMGYMVIDLFGRFLYGHQRGRHRSLPHR